MLLFCERQLLISGVDTVASHYISAATLYRDYLVWWGYVNVTLLLTRLGLTCQNLVKLNLKGKKDILGNKFLTKVVLKLDLAFNNVKPKDWYFVFD